MGDFNGEKESFLDLFKEKDLIKSYYDQGLQLA